MEWIEKCRATHSVHVAKLLIYEGWRVQDTAKILKMSIGAASQDITLAIWLKKDDKVQTFRYAKDALAYIKYRKDQEMMS